ncbi:MAG: hypothetical protein FWE70_04300 [Oscillospiraceae bacterium]|nr:hypothetical protein [Oscillospiraceae bacterium]
MMDKDTVYAYVSTGDGSSSLRPSPPIPMAAARVDGGRALAVDLSSAHQPLLGMGGTWTDTDVHNLLRMGEAEQEKVLEALFDPRAGIGWNLMRLPLGSTDWESRAEYYTYDDMPPGERDWDLSRFSVAKDDARGYFGLLRRCLKVNPELRFVGSVWGVPGWMKENGSIMFGRFDMACVDVYARYLRMAVQAFGERGVGLHAITTQNEPLCGDGRETPACRFTWRMQKEVVIALRREFGLHGIGTEIWAYDHNFDMARVFVEPLLADPEARAAIDGVAMHDYGGSPTEMGRLSGLHPDVPFYMTERFISTAGEMDNLVQQLRNGARSYIQWKTVSDEYGGPHQFLGRPFPYHRPTRKERLPFIYNLLDDPNRWFKAPSYGLYGQFTKFIRRGMLRVDCTGGHKGWLTAAAFADAKTLCACGRGAVGTGAGAGPDTAEAGGQACVAVVAVNQTPHEQEAVLVMGGAEARLIQPGDSVATYLVVPGGLALGSASKVASYKAPTPPPEPEGYDLEPAGIVIEGAMAEGEEALLSCLIRNVGRLPTPAGATISVTFELDGDERVSKATVCAPPIPPGGEVKVTSNIPFGRKRTWTAEAGWHTLFAIVEMGNCRPEADAGNNRLGMEAYFEPRPGPT